MLPCRITCDCYGITNFLTAKVRDSTAFFWFNQNSKGLTVFNPLSGAFYVAGACRLGRQPGIEKTVWVTDLLLTDTYAGSVHDKRIIVYFIWWLVAKSVKKRGKSIHTL